MITVKRSYKMMYDNEQQFVERFTKWVLDPKGENLLMIGAVQSFNVMPKQPFNKEDITKITKYIYNNELDNQVGFKINLLANILKEWILGKVEI